MQHLSFHPVVIPDTFDGRIEGLSRLEVNTNSIAFRLFLLKPKSNYAEINDRRVYLKSNDDILDIISTVRCQRLRDDE